MGLWTPSSSGKVAMVIRSTEDLLTEAYSEVAARLLDALIEFMASGRRDYGDFERLLLLVTLAQRAYSEPDFAKRALSSARPSLGGFRPLPTNLLSLSRATAMPRETVRRKVNELIAAGLVERFGSQVALTAAGVRELRSARQALIAFTARQHDLVARLLLEQTA